MEFADLVMKRRAIRRFSDEPVDRMVLENIARLAQHTPSAGFSQGQRLVPVGVIPVGHPLPDLRSPSLKRGWLALEEFAHFEGW